MMLTKRLEDLLWDGHAEYKTHIHGVSGAGTIPVPNKAFIVILGFTYYDFIDVDGDGGTDYTPNMARRNTLVTFTATKTKKNWQYAVRDTFTTSGLQGNTEATVVGGAHRYFHCYQLHKDDVAIDIIKYRPTKQWGGNTKLPFTPDSNEPPVKLQGYGITVDVIQNQFLEAPTGQNLVPAKKRARTGHFATDTDDTIRSSYIVETDSLTSLNDIVQGSLEAVGNQAYPILNIDYVLINQNAPADMFK